MPESRIQRQRLVGSEYAGRRADQVAATLLGEFSRERVKRWMKEGVLLLDGLPAQPSDRVAGGEHLSLDVVLVAEGDWQPDGAIKLDVVHAHAEFLILNKAAGLVMHPGAGNPDGTLANGLLAAYPELAAVPRAGIIHRLDMGTSGLVMVARTLGAHHRLVAALAARQVSRRYLAVLTGALAWQCRVAVNVGRHQRIRTRMAAFPAGARGRPALTFFTPIAAGRDATLIEATLSTGRTHQIRVHAAHLGQPLVGDPTYGKRASDFERPALHAWELGFQESGQWLRFTAAPPADFRALCVARQLVLPPGLEV